MTKDARTVGTRRVRLATGLVAAGAVAASVLFAGLAASNAPAAASTSPTAPIPPPAPSSGGPGLSSSSSPDGTDPGGGVLGDGSGDSSYGWSPSAGSGLRSGFGPGHASSGGS